MAGQTKRAKKVSNGVNRGAKKSPMDPLFLVLNDKGIYRKLNPKAKKK